MESNAPSSPAVIGQEELGVMRRLSEAFGRMPDTRQSGKVLHRLDEVLVCAFCSILCDGDSFTDMEDFAQTQLGWLRGFLVLEHGAPSHDVFRNVFMMLRPQAVLELLGGWCGPLQGRHVAIDGKTLRGTQDAESGRHLVHLVRAWVDECSLSAGQVLCAEKSNEIEAIPRLLAALELRGATVTIDAMGTQPAIAAQIHEAGADYVLALKANQKGALAAVEVLFGDTPALQEAVPGQPALPASPPPGAVHQEVLELSHGRCERREHQLLGSLEGFAKSWKWEGLQAVGKVRREVQRGRDGPPLVEQHYFLCSFKEDVERFATLVRGHWSVENRCHWVLDVTFGEDHCQVRDKTAAHNFSLLRELAMKTLRGHSSKLSLRRKRRRAALDPAFRSELLDLVHT